MRNEKRCPGRNLRFRRDRTTIGGVDYKGYGSLASSNGTVSKKEKQGLRKTSRRWIKAFLVYLTCRQLLTERFVNRIVRGLRHD